MGTSIELERLRPSNESYRSVSLAELARENSSHDNGKASIVLVPYYLLSFIFLFSLGESIQAIPKLQLYRFHLCQLSTGAQNFSLYSADANPFAASGPCITDAISVEVATMDGWVTSVGMLLSVITSLFWGRTSDVMGRQWTFRICAIGAVLSQILFLMAIWTPFFTFGIYFASFLGGLFGAPAALVSVSYAMLSDILDERARLLWFMRVVGMWYAARIVGPSIGSYLLSVQLLSPVYWATISICSSLAVLRWLPETLRSFSKRSSTQQEFYTSLTSISLCFSNHNLTIIAATNFSYFFGICIIPILTIYVNTTAGWSIEAAGYLSSFQAILKFLAALVLIPLGKRCLLGKITLNNDDIDMRIALYSLLIDGVSWLSIAMLPSSCLLISVALGCLGVGATSSMRTLAVSQVPPEDHGRLFAALGVVDALAATVAAPVLAWIYGVTSSSHPASVFAVVGLIFCASGVTYLWYRADDRTKVETEFTSVMFSDE